MLLLVVLVPNGSASVALAAPCAGCRTPPRVTPGRAQRPV
jgi:hypothetical protein